MSLNKIINNYKFIIIFLIIIVIYFYISKYKNNSKYSINKIKKISNKEKFIAIDPLENIRSNIIKLENEQVIANELALFFKNNSKKSLFEVEEVEKKLLKATSDLEIKKEQEENDKKKEKKRKIKAENAVKAKLLADAKVKILTKIAKEKLEKANEKEDKLKEIKEKVEQAKLSFDEIKMLKEKAESKIELYSIELKEHKEKHEKEAKIKEEVNTLKKKEILNITISFLINFKNIRDVINNIKVYKGTKEHGDYIEIFIDLIKLKKNIIKFSKNKFKISQIDESLISTILDNYFKVKKVYLTYHSENNEYIDFSANYDTIKVSSGRYILKLNKYNSDNSKENFNNLYKLYKKYLFDKNNNQSNININFLEIIKTNIRFIL